MKCEQMSSLHVPSVDCVLCSKPPRNALAMSCLKFTRGYCATTLVRRSPDERGCTVSSRELQTGHRQGIPWGLRAQDTVHGRNVQRGHLLAFHPNLQTQQLLRADSKLT